MAGECKGLVYQSPVLVGTTEYLHGMMKMEICMLQKHEEEANEIAKARNLKLKAAITQDEDVLDTWFSSWLWPIEVFKGITNPNNEDIKYYYPTSVLVTGQDIIFFWVARMIMAGMEFMNRKNHSVMFISQVWCVISREER